MKPKPPSEPEPKPKRRSSLIFIWAVFAGGILLILWGNSYFWRNRYVSPPAATIWGIELSQGILSFQRVKCPVDFEFPFGRQEPGWACEWITRPGYGLWEGSTWMPAPYLSRKFPTSAYYHPGSSPAAGGTSGTLEQVIICTTVWQILTLHIALCWIAFSIRQRRRRREWERQQTTGDPQLLETP